MTLSSHHGWAAAAPQLGIDAADALVVAQTATDMGNVSLALPSIHLYIGIESWPAINRPPAFTACCVQPSADTAVIDGAIAMAWTALDIVADGARRARLRNRA